MTHQLKRLLISGGISLVGLLLMIASASADSIPQNQLAFRDRVDQSAIADIKAAELPPEGQQTLELIKRGGPFPYSRDGVTFQNREKLLPIRAKGYYREYTVPTPGARNRGARRIVAGKSSEYFYTNDHYRSFRLIKE